MSACRARRAFAGALALAAAAAFAQADRFAGVTIVATHVAGGVYMLEGAGGNIAVSVGEDGVLMVDDQFAPLAERIAAAIDEIVAKAGAEDGESRPRFVLNTHYHGDHTAGNAFFGRSGVVIAHANVRTRLVAQGMAAAGLPDVTFEDGLRLHFNGAIDVLHLARGHTDGDAMVWFRDAGVAHLGDHFFNGRFPYVDVPSGGSVSGFLDNLARAVDMLPSDIHVIPGHGPLATIDDVKRAMEVIAESRAAVREAMAAGALDALKRDGFGKWEAWGGGFIDAPRWIDIVAASELADLRGGQ